MYLRITSSRRRTVYAGARRRRICIAAKHVSRDPHHSHQNTRLAAVGLQPGPTRQRALCPPAPSTCSGFIMGTRPTLPPAHASDADSCRRRSGRMWAEGRPAGSQLYERAACRSTSTMRWRESWCVACLPSPASGCIPRYCRPTLARRMLAMQRAWIGLFLGHR